MTWSRLSLLIMNLKGYVAPGFRWYLSLAVLSYRSKFPPFPHEKRISSFGYPYKARVSYFAVHLCEFWRDIMPHRRRRRVFLFDSFQDAIAHHHLSYRPATTVAPFVRDVQFPGLICNCSFLFLPSGFPPGACQFLANVVSTFGRGNNNTEDPQWRLGYDLQIQANNNVLDAAGVQIARGSRIAVAQPMRR